MNDGFLDFNCVNNRHRLQMRVRSAGRTKVYFESSAVDVLNELLDTVRELPPESIAAREVYAALEEAGFRKRESGD